MKKLTIVLFILLGFFLSGCSNFFSDPVTDDLLNYVNDSIAPIADLETRAVTAYESVVGANYTDDVTLFNTLENEVIPNYAEFMKKLQIIMPETEEVRNIHEIYVEAVDTQYEAFLAIRVAIDTQDYEEIKKINASLSEARKGIRNYQFKLNSLAKEHGVELQQF